MIGDAWGASDAERARACPCDALAPPHAHACWRAVSVGAPVALTWRWLCQLRAAPYSYDWIDNRGRRSPQALVPGLDRLEPGQVVMTIFTLVSFERERQLTVVNRTRGGARGLFGEVWVSYLLEPEGEGTRLLAKLRIAYPRGPLGALMRVGLPPGDLVMMRRQLLNLKRLAARDARTGVA